MVKPAFIVHDVLQMTLYSPNQLISAKEKPFFDWFKEIMPVFDITDDVTLLVVASGIEHSQEWVSYIKQHPEWKIACHGWEHRSHHVMPYNEMYRGLLKAKHLLERTFNQEVKYMFPPKHKQSKNLHKVCEEIGLKVHDTYKKPDDWLNNNDIENVYFHYWQIRDNEKIRKIKEMTKNAKSS